MNVYIVGYLNNWISSTDDTTLFHIVDDCTVTCNTGKWIYPYQIIISIIRDKFNNVTDDVIIHSINNSDVGKLISRTYNVRLGMVYVSGLGAHNSTVVDFPTKVIGYQYIK